MIKTQEPQRLYYMDALKGLGIILVVYGHFFTHYLHIESPIRNFFDYWYMPLFFFISGYFSYSSNKNFYQTPKSISNRVQRLLHPAFVVCSLYVITLLYLSPNFTPKETILATLYDPAKRGYWFTFSLTQAYLLVTGLQSLYNFEQRSTNERTTFLSILAIITSIIAIIGFNSIDSYPNIIRYIIKTLCLEMTIKYLPFFLIGTICKIQNEQFNRLFKHPITLIFGITIFLISTLIDGVTSYYIQRCSSLLCVISFFLIIEHFLTPNKFLARQIIRLGKTSLPIYLLHFFVFLFLSTYAPKFVEPICHNIKNPLLELLIIGPLSILITEFVYIIDQIISRYNWLHQIIYSY